MTPPSFHTPEDLLAGHVEWIRALARRLADDPETADELAQDACVVALSAEPRDTSRFRAWLAAVMRNLVRERRRGDSHRRQREEHAARNEALAGADRLVEEVQLGRDLAQAVVDLDEPYRTTLLLRFYEDLAPREIARRLDVPVATVNSRLARGLARLRERLERERGGRAAWLSAFAPLLDPPRTLPALSIGGILVNTKLVLCCAAVATVATVLWSVSGSSEREERPNATLASTETPRETPAVERELAGTGSDETSARTAATSANETTPPPVAATTAALVRVRGRVLDGLGAPLGGVHVGSGALSVRGNANGWFELETDAQTLTLAVLEPGWTTVRTGEWSKGATLEPVVVAARALHFAGETVDPQNGPIAGVRVAVGLPAGFDARFDRTLEASSRLSWSAITDARGHFDIQDAPDVAGSVLRALREGWSAATLDAPAADDLGLSIRLVRPPIPLAGSLRGRVLDERGDPVPEARVFLGLASTTTDERGRFGLTLAAAVTSDRIVAIKGGHRPAALDRPRAARADDTGWPAEIELRLGGEPLSIRGTVVDAAGKPKRKARVSLAEPTPIGAIGQMPAFSEAFASGAPVPPLAIESQARLPAEDGDDFWDHHSRVGPSSAFWHYATTDEQGRFEIGGLDDRRYRLHVVDTESLVAHTTEPIRAGATNEEVKLPAPDLWPEIHGRIVDDAGVPIAGVTVRLGAEAFGARARVFGGTSYVSLREGREQTTTDDAGRFTLRGVPRHGMAITMRSESIVPCERVLEPDLDPADLRVEVALRCTFEVRVAAGPDPMPDGIALRDGTGGQVEVLRIEAGSVNAFTGVPLVDGRSGVLSASSVVRTLEFLRDGQVVRSVPIRLRSGEPNLIEL